MLHATNQWPIDVSTSTQHMPWPPGLVTDHNAEWTMEKKRGGWEWQKKNTKTTWRKHTYSAQALTARTSNWSRCWRHCSLMLTRLHSRHKWEGVGERENGRKMGNWGLGMREWSSWLRSWSFIQKNSAMLSTFFDPLSPNIIIQILITGLHRFCWLLIERTRLNIKTIHVWWSFAKFSWSVCVIIHWGDEEKIGADHYWGLKG